MIWWKTLTPADQTIIQKAMTEAAVYQRKDNRDKNAARLALLKDKGMIIEENPDFASFRAKVANLKDMDLFKEPKVHALLLKMIEASK